MLAHPRVRAVVTPAARYRLAAAMTALAALACDTPAHTPAPATHDTPPAASRRPDLVDTTRGLDQALADATRTTTPRAARSQPRPAHTDANRPPAATGDIWTRLAECESGGNPRAVSPTGKYRGLLQFSIQTWRSVGMTGDPIDHTPAEQLAAGRRLQARSGFGQWRACARRLGLL